MKTVEDIIKQMVLGATHVVKHREAPTAQAVTEFRQTLLTDVKAISESGSAELIVAMEKALAQHDLEYYANSKTMIGSLKTALSEFAMIERQLGKVDDPEQYKATDQSFGLAKIAARACPWMRPGRRSKATTRGWSIWIKRRWMICKKSSSRRASQVFIGRSNI